MTKAASDAAGTTKPTVSRAITRAVADLAPERRVGEDRAVVLPDPRVRQADRVRRELQAGAEAAEDRERQRDDHDGEHDQRRPR